MAITAKECANPKCQRTFLGKSNKKFCSDDCRWRTHVDKNRELEALQAAIEGKTVDRARLGRANRAKGARAEREVCDLLTAISGSKVKRNLSQTRDAGSDVQWGPFLLEVKYQQAYALPAWQRQVKEAVRGTDLLPAVVYRRPQEEFWISLPFVTFVTLFETLRKAAQGHG